MCKKLSVRAPRVMWLVALAVVWTMTGYGGMAFGQVAGVDDPSDMDDSSGDIKRIEAWVDGGNLHLTMTVYGVAAPSIEETPARMTNRYYYHWLLDTDNDPATGFSNSEYEGNATNLQTPIGADLVVMLGWRDGNPNGVEVYDPLTEEILFEDFEYTNEGDTIHAVLPLADLGLTPDDTIAVSAFQEGASSDWQVDWVESAVLSLEVVEPINPGTAGLAAYYPLDADATDASGNGLDGTIMGDPELTAGIMGGAMEFDGDDDYIDCGVDASLDIPGPIALALWIRPGADDPEGTGLETAPMAKAMNGINPPWSWQVRYGWGGPAPYMAFTFNTSPRAWVFVGQNLERDEWAHIACSHDGETLLCYLNGEETDSTPMGAITGSPTPVLIGQDGWGSNWLGAIDEVMIYNRSLSAGEVQWLAGLRPIPVDPGSEGLVAYYPLDADATDASGNGLDGTIMGDPEPIEGIMGGAMQFDGDGDYIDCGNDASLDIASQISLSLWIRPDADDPEGTGLETAPMCKALSSASPSWSWQVRYGWNSPQPYMAFTFNTSPRAWAYVGQNLEQGEWAHIACAHDGATLTAYLNGVATESTPMGAITSSPAPVLIGQDGWGSDWIGGIDEVMIFDRALSGGEIMYLAGYLPDVTAPGDAIQGVPNDGETTGGGDNGWPGAETPDLAIDDDVNTKFLHFKGEVEPTSIQVTPSIGATIVTGLTFTTANDAVERDPVTFELSGSNDGIDGPYTLIASGEISDFAAEEAWPRFTKNETAILFNNDVAYTSYQLLFTSVRDAASANSMQIAEVELAGAPAQ